MELTLRQHENRTKERVLLGYKRMHPDTKAFKISWTQRDGFRVLDAMNQLVEKFDEWKAAEYLKFNDKFVKAADVPVGAYYQIEGRKEILVKDYNSRKKEFVNDSFKATYGTCICRVLSIAEKNEITAAQK